MSIAKVIEVIAEGASIEDAVQSGVKQASKSLKNVKAVNVENVQGLVNDSKVIQYRVNLKITFVVD